MENKNIIEFVKKAKQTGILSFENVWIDYDKIKIYFYNDLKDITEANFVYGGIEKDFAYKLDNHIFELKQLKYLNLSYYCANNILDKFDELPKLETLLLNSNNLKEFPESIKRSKTIKKLGLLRNDFIDYHLVFELNKSEKNTFQKLKKYFATNDLEINIDYPDKEFYNWGICLKAIDYDIYLYEDARFGLNISLILIKNNESVEIDKYKLYSDFKKYINEVLKDIFIIEGDKEIYQNDFYVGINDLKQWLSEGRILTPNFNRFQKYKINELIEQIGGKELYNELIDEIKKENIESQIEFKPLSDLKLQNFKLFENLEINNLSPKLNVIVGKNGFGKTSILQAITLLFTNEFLEEKDSDLNKKYINKNVLNYNWIYNENIAEITYDKNTKIIKEYGYESTYKLKNNFIVLSYGVNLFSREKYNHDDFARAIILGNESPISVFSIFEEYSDLFYDPIQVLDKMEYYIFNSKEFSLIEKKEIKKILEKIIDCLNKFLQINENNNYEIKLINKNHYFKNTSGQWKTAELSEGYRANILLISDILFRIVASRKRVVNFENKPLSMDKIFEDVKGIILIDEFDRHLHPEWQRKFIGNIKNIFKNIQFILTTHNPMSLLDCEGNEIILLDTDENNNILVSKNEDDINYLDISNVYLKYFVHEITNSALKNELEKYNKLYIDNKKETVEFLEIENKLKNSFIGFTITDIRYLKFLNFLKKLNIKFPNKLENSENWDFSEEELIDLMKE